MVGTMDYDENDGVCVDDKEGVFTLFLAFQLL